MMTDQEVFASIASQLAADRRWMRRLRWVLVRSRLASMTVRAFCHVAPVAGVWIL